MLRNQEIRPLTSLRFIAALLVFLFHFYGLPERATTLWEAIITEGYVGVTLFLVLSGFLIALLYFERVKDKGWRFDQYFIRRVARVCPIYYFLLLVVFVLQLRSGEFSSKDALIHLTMTQGYFLRYWSHDIPTAWTLSVEMTFYLMAPGVFLLYWWVQRQPIFRGRRLMPLTAYLIAVFAAMVLLGAALQKLSIATGLVSGAGFMGGFEIAGTSTIQNTTIFFRFFEFAVGIWCANVYVWYLRDGFWLKPSSRWVATALCIAAVCGMIILQYFMDLRGGFYDRKGYLFNYPIALVGGLLVLALTRQDTPVYRLMSCSLPVYLGRISYGLYLLQFFPGLVTVLLALAALVGLHIPDVTGANPLRALYLYLGMSVVSAILYETVEKYGGRFVLRAYERLRGAPTS